jgi:hypothetical protein
MSCLSSTLLAVLVLLTTVATYGLVLMVHAVHALTPPPPPPCPTFRTGERIAFSHLISKKFVGEKARLEVLRDGQQTALDVT